MIGMFLYEQSTSGSIVSKGSLAFNKKAINQTRVFFLCNCGSPRSVPAILFKQSTTISYAHDVSEKKR